MFGKPLVFGAAGENKVMEVMEVMEGLAFSSARGKLPP
jgi:hypothetical protein